MIRPLLAALLFASASTGAWAHAALTKSNPGNREVLAQSPDAIHLRFNEKVEAKFSKLSLEDAQGKAIELGAPAAAAADDPYALQAPLAAALAAGRYTVRYRVLSQDGHVIEKSFVFTIEAPKTPAP